MLSTRVHVDMSAGEYPSNITTVPQAATRHSHSWDVGWGVFWRVVGFGSLSGLILGALYTVPYLFLELLTDTLGAAPQDHLAALIATGGVIWGMPLIQSFGLWAVGGAIGLMWGLALGILLSLVLIVALRIAPRLGLDVRYYRLMFLLLTFDLIGVGHLPFSIWLSSDRTTGIVWTVEFGLPIAMATCAFMFICYFVSGRVIKQLSTASMVRTEV